MWKFEKKCAEYWRFVIFYLPQHMSCTCRVNQPKWTQILYNKHVLCVLLMENLVSFSAIMQSMFIIREKVEISFHFDDHSCDDLAVKFNWGDRDIIFCPSWQELKRMGELKDRHKIFKTQLNMTQICETHLDV